HRDRLGVIGRQSLTGLLVLAGINLFIGFSMPGVDNFAHMGGFAAGFALALPLAPKYQPVHDIWGKLVSLRDTNSILKQWWVIPVGVVVLVLGTMLGSGTIGENPFTHLRQAERYLDDGEHTSAFDEVSKAIQIEPRLADSYIVRAKILTDLGDYPSALTELGLAVRLGLDDRDREEVVALMIDLRSRLR
ncbi:MAG: rhomboid family intramembrane serine protease, partial [Chloroflexi bacterium]|nr:rhomboid family intramembrane serine protease [Chloroflexota bacterium]